MIRTLPPPASRVLHALFAIFPVMVAALPMARAASVDERVESLLARMTIEEKVGQLNQYSAPWSPTGPMPVQGDLRQDIASGQVGSMFNVVGADATRALQEVAMQSRLRIPLLFGQDVIHGYLTTFPIPLGEAASFDLEAIERSARIAATEAAAGGIHWTFAPMVDISRDPRWGRVMEGAGEDPYLGSRVAAARVRGFQGAGLGDTASVMATAKHFAAYGAATGGRDYNSVDMGLRTLREIYLPPFQAAAEAGAASFMNSFNDINGIPATGNRMLLTDILKGEWGFRGIVVSDWGSIGEMVPHGYARDLADAAREAITAGNDMDMQSEAYRKHLAALVAQGKVPMARVEDAVRRVLRKKFELGLFEDPFRFSDAAREKRVLADPAHRRAAREVAGRSIVLLRNEGGVLPIAKGVRTIAFVGPLAKVHQENHGGWSVSLPGVDYDGFVASQWDALHARLGAGTRLLYARGCAVEGEDRAGFAEAIEAARQSDLVIASVGESWTMSGEARSRSDIGLPGVQEDLLRALHATGKPMVVLINAGRPLVFPWTADHAQAILYTWWLGTEAGNAIADVLLGEVNPAARLPMSFPRSVGQVPLYYNHLNTGRPSPTDLAGEYKSGYIDLPNSPRFPFGYGLSYTSFEYSGLALDRHALHGTERILVTLQVKNTGARAGDEVVQLYLRQRIASVVRPVQELKEFRRIHLAAGESRELRFEIDREKLAFWNERLRRVTEPGDFDLMLGASSEDIRLRDAFVLAD
jgi:beta-glucosidase